MVAFFVLVWIALIAILALSPAIFMNPLGGVSDKGHAVEVAFLVALSALIALLLVGTIRRWRWTFWLILIAFFAGALRIPASALELAGLLPASGPSWYTAFQGGIGAVQFLIAIAMLAGHRKAGIWGEF